MADEEIQRAIEFIVQQQAKYAARLEKDAPRLAMLEESFKLLVELARGADERLDQNAARLDQNAARLDQDAARLDQDAARFERDESRLARLEESFTMLVELARATDERLDTLGETTATLSHTINELLQRTITDQSRLARLEESFTMLVELAHRH